MFPKDITIFCIYFVFHFAITNAQLIPFRTKQLYNFENQIDFQDLGIKPYHSGYRIESQLSVSSEWNQNEFQLMHFELEAPQHVAVKISRNKNDIPKYSKENVPELTKFNKLQFYLLLENGKISQFLTNTDDKDVFSLNFKRGLASLFQFNVQEGNIEENDLLGQCNVLYKSKSSTKYTKLKSNCRNWELKVNQRHENPIGVQRKSYQEIHYELTQDSILLNLQSTEEHSANVAVKTDVGGKLESEISLKHISSDVAEQNSAKTIDKLLESLKGFTKFNIEADIDGRLTQLDSSLKQVLKNYKSEMENYKIGKLPTANIFAKLLPIARITNTKEFIQILKSPSMQESQHQLIDLIGATQTIDAHKAFTSVFNFENEDEFDAVERYLQALAISTRPQKDIFLDIYEILSEKNIENEKLIDTILQTLSSMAYKYTKYTPEVFEDPIVQKIKKYLIHKLNACENVNCKLMHIRGLQNLKDPSTIPILMQQVFENDNVAAVQAMKALNVFHIDLFSKKNRLDFERIFYQVPKKFDSSVRNLALDILLTMKPSKYQLENLLNYLKSNDKNFEVKTYLIQKFEMIMSKCPRFTALLKSILKDKSDVNNYHVIGQKGLTTVFQRPLSTTPAFNESLLSIQEIYNGVLKQGNVDLVLHGGSEEFSTFKLGLFTSGLSSFVISDNTESENSENPEEEPITAGMEITVQNVHFRPLVFFNGQTELMGHVWSGTASEPTTAYQATVLQQDHEEYILLQNGATIYLQIIGAKSIDLNGKVEFSLWNRNAHTEIKQNSGVAIVGSMTYGTTFLQMENKFSTNGNPKINVVADIDFYSDVILCIQLGKPNSNFWHKIENSLNILGTSYSKKNVVNISYKLPGNTMALNRKNNEMCNKIA